MGDNPDHPDAIAGRNHANTISNFLAHKSAIFQRHHVRETTILNNPTLTAAQNPSLSTGLDDAMHPQAIQARAHAHVTHHRVNQKSLIFQQSQRQQMAANNAERYSDPLHPVDPGSVIVATGVLQPSAEELAAMGNGNANGPEYIEIPPHAMHRTPYTKVLPSFAWSRVR